ncbi:Activating signal cointegrator 1 [Homalodisca vitripennis]|nr:Activating signal cointegrator 1 [Homalodisca vitripennis]
MLARPATAILASVFGHQTTAPNISAGSGVGYKKNEIEEDFFAPKVEKKKKDKGNKSQPASATSKKGVADQPAQAKKKKFVNLYSQEGQNRDVVLLKGRHKCDCQASKHKLINNCLKCGRIVCEQEGSGPCLFCGNLVSRKDKRIRNGCFGFGPLILSTSTQANYHYFKVVPPTSFTTDQ